MSSHFPRGPAGNLFSSFVFPGSLSDVSDLLHRRFFSVLAIILCAGALGSIPFTQQFLFSHAASKTTTPSSSTQLTGQCTASPQDLAYLPITAQDQRPYATPLPAAWFDAGLQEKDFAYAHACAADFVLRYQTFDAAHLETLEASTFMFSPGARLRFYGRLPHSIVDIHMDNAWRVDLVKHHEQETASVYPPYLLTVCAANQHFFAWLVVSYEISLKSDNQVVTRNGSYTVLLHALNPGSKTSPTGWQVSDWRSGIQLFPISDPI